MENISNKLEKIREYTDDALLSLSSLKMFFCVTAYMYVEAISYTIYKVRSAYFRHRKSLTSWRNSFLEELEANAAAGAAIIPV